MFSALLRRAPQKTQTGKPREQVPLLNGAIQKALWFQLPNQGHQSLYYVILCLEFTVRVLWCCLNISHRAFWLASDIILDNFLLTIEHCLTGSIPLFFSHIPPSPPSRRNKNLLLFLAFALCYSELPKLTANKFI